MTITEPARRTRPRRRLRVAGALVVVLVIAATVYHFVTAPSPFSSGNELSGPLAVGEPALIGMDTAYPAQTLTIKKARAAVRENSADARIQMLICRKKDGVQLGGDRGSLKQYCRSTTPADGHVIEKSTWDDEYILARVVARRPGTVRFDGVDITYARGWKYAWINGHGRTGTHVKLTVK